MQISDLLLLLPALLGFFFLWGLRPQKPVTFRQPERTHTQRPPANAIVVDGSNVMHWGPEPSDKVLAQVLRSVERAGHVPIVFFDANAGYVLDDQYYNEAKLAALIGIAPEHICVVDKGVVADEAILSFASDFDLRVVTNDRYRDWRIKFPHAAKKAILLSGTWREGTVVWHGKLWSQVVSA